MSCLQNYQWPFVLFTREKGTTWGFFFRIARNLFGGLTLEEALDPQVAYTEPKYRKLVQLRDDVRGEGEQASQAVQLSVQPITVPFGRV